MSRLANHPRHGANHAPGGSDPIPGVGSGGDYVFLSEIIVASDGDPIEFTAISQGYRHLRAEAFLAVAGDAETDVIVKWNGNGLNYSWATLANRNGTGEAPTDTDDIGVRASGVVPPATFSGDDEPNLGFCQFFAEFSYYALADVVKAVTWRATAMVQDALPVFASGGGESIYHGNDSSRFVDPIESVALTAPVGFDWLAGSRASLYGVT